jgi:hypothetical protein
MPSRETLLAAAARLHAYLEQRHWRDGVLRGPDPGVRFNLRLWRFAKSALDFVPWRDDYLFLQSQGYWVLSNWLLQAATGEERYRALALRASDAILRHQRADGAWAYPLPERRHLVATVEGCWASLGLLASYAREPRPEFLAGAVRWYEFLVSRIGFQEHATGKAVNYFDRPRGKVPNNSVLAAWFLLRLWKASGDERFLEHVPAMLEFLAAAQLPSGELPYIVDGPLERGRAHYLCFQYNAFQFLELARLSRFEAARRAEGIAAKLAAFLPRGVTPEGACANDCFRPYPEVNYYTAALAAALGTAAQRGWIGSKELSERCYTRLLSRQRADGGFDFSSRDYGFLGDTRSYPRQMAMTLFHLLDPLGGDGFPPPPS